MTRIETIKQIIKENYEYGNCGIYNTVNLIGDEMCTLYSDGEVYVDICFYWSYFEVIGLPQEEFNKVKEYYYSLGR